MPEYDIRPIDGDAEIDRFAEIISLAFTVPIAEERPWFEKLGHGNLRVVDGGDGIVGGLGFIPMGQYFGAKSVPMVGIAGVAVAPEARGRGAASALMRAAIRELAERGVALSALYPATLPLYRSAGYEQAGSRHRIRIAPSDIGVRERELELRRVTESDYAAVEELYRETARDIDGYLDRGKYIWDRVRLARDSPAQGYLVEGDDGIESYLFAVQKPTIRMKHDFALTDLVAKTARGARRLLAFVASDHSLGSSVTWFGGPDDLFVGHLDDARYEMMLADHWMLRIIDVAAALTARGYVPGVSAKLELEIDDPLVDGNAGRFVLVVEEGRGTVTKGGGGAFRCNVRGLASLYSGFRSPRQLRRLNLADGTDASFDAASLIFGSPASPSMPDNF